ncbi:MAG: BatD family protein [Gemmatimonadaceae bacterium]
MTTRGTPVRLMAAALLLFGVQPASAQAGRPPVGADAVPAVVTQGRIDARREVNFSAIVVPESVYVGQQATYQIGVFLSEDVGQRLRRNPEFVPPDVRSMLTYDLPPTPRPMTRQEAGQRYDVHVFQRALFPLTEGTHALDPARLTYALPLTTSIFSREETRSARTSALRIVARQPPQEGRPTDYQGAVGRLSLSARVDAASSRVGDPVTLIVTVSGVGNVSLFPRPAVTLAMADVVRGAERVHIDSAASLISGGKDFEWVVTPRAEGTLEIPALRYPFFNPYSERYEVALTTPLTVRVHAGGLAARPQAITERAPRLPLRTSFRGALPPPLASSPLLWFALAAIPVPALALGVGRRQRRARARTRAEALRATLPGGNALPSDVRRMFASAVSERTGSGSAVMSDGTRFMRTLRRAGVSADTALRAQAVLTDLDLAVYGAIRPASAPALAERALAAYQAIDDEAIPSSTLRLISPAAARTGARVVAVVGLLAGGVLAGAVDDATVRARFAHGMELYDGGRYDAAVEEFRAVARDVPRAADAWANMGTAGFQANDTATAAIGWQHALRLEPLASDVRGNLEATPGFDAGFPGDVPPIPLDLAALVGTLLWLGGWGVLAWGAWRRSREGRALGALSVGLSFLVLLGSLSLAEKLSGRHHVIVVAPERLRISPALSAEVGSEVMTGESARETGQQGVWSRLRFPDGRTGWMESRRLESLETRGTS